MVPKIIEVGGMTCDHCVRTIRTGLATVDGIGKLGGDLGASRVAVTLDEQRVELARTEAVTGEAGFEPRAGGGGQ